MSGTLARFFEYILGIVFDRIVYRLHGSMSFMLQPLGRGSPTGL